MTNFSECCEIYKSWVLALTLRFLGKGLEKAEKEAETARSEAQWPVLPVRGEDKGKHKKDFEEGKDQICTED